MHFDPRCGQRDMAATAAQLACKLLPIAGAQYPCLPSPGRPRTAYRRRWAASITARVIIVSFSIGGIIHNCNSLISRPCNVMQPIDLAAPPVGWPLHVVRDLRSHDQDNIAPATILYCTTI
jgi:hypothetical protein